MKGSLKRLVSRIRGGQKGFTLIEMIVVVGIIAVLAAVIVPNMGKFIGQGERGAMAAEQDAVQTAMKAMMANMSIQTVSALNTGSTASKDWAANPVPGSTGAEVLETYLQSPNTVYYYCWDISGNIKQQEKEISTACTN